MKRSIKGLGLVVLAIGAVGALLAQGALAANHKFEVASTPALITGEAHPQATQQTFVVGSSEPVKCSALHLTGTDTETPSEKVELIPQYSNCSFAGLEMTVTNVGSTKLGETEGACKFVFKGETKANASTPGTEDAPFDIRCETGKSITIEIFTGTNHAEGQSICTLHIGEQAGLQGLTYTNVETAKTPMEITAHAKVHKIAYTATGELCSLGGISPGSGTNAKYEGTATIRAFVDNNGTKGSQINTTAP